MKFKPNKHFKSDYDCLFRQDPGAANLFLLLCELAHETGQVRLANPEELVELMAARFQDPKEYQL